MESSNCCTGRKVTGSFAGVLGFLYGLILFAFLSYVESEMYYQAPRVYKAILLMCVTDILASILWLWGCLKDRKELILTSLICWGASLNLWLGYIFLFTIQIIPYGPDIHYNYTTFEALIPTVTLVLVFFYICLMLIYNAFGKGMNKIFKSDCKLNGFIAGWIMIAFTVGETLLFFSQADQSDLYLYGGILLFVLNSVAACTWNTWLYGIPKFKIAVMVIALISWLIPLVIWNGLIIYGIIEKGYHPGNRHQHTYNPIYSITVFYTGLYIYLAYISTKVVAMQRNRPDSNQFNVTYAPPPTLHNKFTA